MADRYIDAVEDLARARLEEPVHRYFRQGARDGVSAGEAVAAWDRLRLRPRVLNDVTTVDLTTELLGTRMALPVAIAPTTLQRAAHAEGEVAMARAAAEAEALLVVSSNAGSPFERIGDTGVAWWLQVYLTSDRGACLPLLRRAREAGARCVVLTVDTPVVGTKYDGSGPTAWDVADPAWLRANFEETGPGAPSAEKAMDLGPRDIEWLSAAAGLPVVVKGVLHPADARRCAEAGASAVWVSNHGGRQLDGALSTVDALADVAAEAGADVEILVDGGLRRGRHLVAAAALGARACFLGRPPLFALAAGGPAGVVRLLTELGEELAETLRLVGCATPSEVSRDLVTAPDLGFRPPARPGDPSI